MHAVNKFYVLILILAFLHSVHLLLVTANTVPSSPILVTMMIEVIRSSEMYVLTRATPCNIQEDCIFHSRQSDIDLSFSFVYFPPTCLFLLFYYSCWLCNWLLAVDLARNSEQKWTGVLDIVWYIIRCFTSLTDNWGEVSCKISCTTTSPRCLYIV
jgi:hypothetical protein